MIHRPYTILLFILLLFTSACVRVGTELPEAPSFHNNLPKYALRIKGQVNHAEGLSQLPRKVYVFPPLWVDASFQPLNQYRSRIGPGDKLFWTSSAPLAGEIQETLIRAMQRKGFRSLTFDQLARNESDHSVTVINLYFSKIRPEKWQDQSTGRWLASLRVTASTYPASLVPVQKRDLIQMDAIIVFNDEAHYPDAVKRSYRYVTDRMMSKGSFNETLSLLE